jgi:tetratricopeptide (TPR) repeat protein
LWSGNYDRNLDDIFAIQDEIANEVVGALKVSLLGEVAGTMDRDQTENLDAYTEYLLGINELTMHSSDSLKSALAHLQAAVEYDPEYSRGWSTLGRAYLELEDYGILPTSEAHEAAAEAASRALVLFPESSEALAVLGMAKLLVNEFDQAGELLEQAIEYGPNDIAALTYYGRFLLTDARPEEAIAAFEKATRLDPLSENAYIVLANQYLSLDEPDKALSVIARLRAIDPDNPNASGSYSYAMALKGRYADAIQAMKTAHEQDLKDPEMPFVLGTMHLAIDLPDEARRWFDRAAEIDPEHPVSRAGPVVLGYYLQTDNAANARLARTLLDDGIENRRGARGMSLRVMLDHAKETNNFDAFFEVMDNLYPHLLDDPPTDLEKDYMGTYFAGVAYKHSGDAELGQELLRWLESEAAPFVKIYGADRSDINLLLELGDRDRALQTFSEFRKQIFSSEFNALLLRGDHAFDVMRDEPEFVSLMQEYDRNAAEQRELLQAMNAN